MYIGRAPGGSILMPWRPNRRADAPRPSRAAHGKSSTVKRDSGRDPMLTGRGVLFVFEEAQCPETFAPARPAVKNPEPSTTGASPIVTGSSQLQCRFTPARTSAGRCRN